MSDTITIPYRYTPRHYQLPLWQYMDNTPSGARAVSVAHRRAGKDLNALNITIKKMLERPGLYWHILPTYQQGKKIVWDGMDGTGRPFLDYFPKALLDGEPNNTELRVRLKNGSIWQVVGTDDPSRLVGTNPVGCVWSEYSIQNPDAWEYVRPIHAENGGWDIFIFTPRGKNHGHRILNLANKNPKWFAEVLTVNDTHAISQEAIDEERASGMPEEMIQQEYYCSFDAPLQGAYYAEQMMRAEQEQRITNVPYESRLPVHTAWDLGVDDSTTIWFFQQSHLEIRLIDYEEFSGEGLPRCAKALSSRPYSYGVHYAPHDIEVRDFSANGRTRREIARSLGINFRTGKKLPVQEGIEAVRSLLNKCWFDEKKCAKGIESLREYRKDYDEKLKVFRSSPRHDAASHGADAFREMANNVRDHRSDHSKPKTTRLTAHDPFAWASRQHSQLPVTTSN